MLQKRKKKQAPTIANLMSIFYPFIVKGGGRGYLHYWESILFRLSQQNYHAPPRFSGLPLLHGSASDYFGTSAHFQNGISPSGSAFAAGGLSGSVPDLASGIGSPMTTTSRTSISG